MAVLLGPGGVGRGRERGTERERREEEGKKGEASWGHVGRREGRREREG